MCVFAEAGSGAPHQGLAILHSEFGRGHLLLQCSEYSAALPIGPIVVPFLGWHLEFYEVIPKRNYYGAYGY